ncbi:DUF4435 domain-containing protein [Lactococcus lactis subsp. lactis]|uniref:DUF4435 domain-containing protein n=1 Tax=Lactococcus lactis TaxID=1358 RepID=UPI00223A87B8|nr:DUF4435 domain-containing protein [Lactococcus lactis]MCT0017115.1 DUF4435 domain-containing protein [Lactococcus lactis subsp. lactis]
MSELSKLKERLVEVKSELSEYKEAFDKSFLEYTQPLSDSQIEELKELPKLMNFWDKSVEDFDCRIKSKNSISPQFLNLFESIFGDSNYFHSFSRTNAGGNLWFQNLLSQGKKSLIQVNQALERLGKLSTLDGLMNAIIIGANGTGKSSFAEYFKSSFPDSIVALPAQKLLYFEMNNNLISTTFSEVQQLQKQTKLKENNFQSPNSYINSQRNIHHEFSQIIAAFVSKSYGDAVGVIIDEKNIYYKFLNIFQTLYPSISFEEYLKADYKDIANRELKPQKRNELYSINQMSDGEKVTIYYILQILLAPNKATIIVDEPETYLNASLYNRLWDMLENIRSDCRFIYISHRLDFIESRKNVDFIWFKNFDAPDEWEFQFIDTEISEKFPKELLIQLTGVKKDVLFCEGTDKSSLDYSIYQSLFPEITVIPVGSCNEVIRYTKSYNNNKSVFINHAYGIIDNDLRTDTEVSSLENEQIFVTQYLEIEMLMCDENVIKAILNANFDEHTNEKLEKFQSEFIQKISSKKQKLITQREKKEYEVELQNCIFDTSLSFEDNLSNLTEKLKDINKSTRFSERLDCAVDNKNFQELLNLCTLEHDEITGGIGNRAVDSKFAEKARNHILNDSELKNILKGKYFEKIVGAIAHG